MNNPATLASPHHAPRGKRLWRSESGQAILEITLVMPLLLIIAVGAAELGRLAYAGIVLTSAARAGIQYGAQSHSTAADTAGMQQAALNDGQNVSGMTATVTRTCACSDGSASTCAATDCSASRLIGYVQVNTAATVKMLFHCPGLPDSLNVQGQAVMRVAQ